MTTIIACPTRAVASALFPLSRLLNVIAHLARKLTSPSQATEKPDHFGGVFTTHDDPSKKPDKDEDKRIKAVLERLRHYGVDSMVESNAKYALRASKGDAEAAFRLLMLLQDTYEGLVKPYSPDTRLLGAVNREGTTCYLDALLFAMFARLDSFEAMLYDNFEDRPRKKLAGLLRLWVNMLRTGKLITTDVTQHLQASLAECGWADAVRLKQQDSSEAFTFITGKLELPLLTLKMDLYHTGKPDPADDHKFVNERLLEVAILEEAPEGRSVVTLEDCLEHYFNNRIEIKRHLENQRRNTLQSIKNVAPETGIQIEKEPGTHVEVLELQDRPDSPLVASPAAETPTQSKDPFERLRPTMGRKRADSIFSQRKVEMSGGDPEKDEAFRSANARERKLSTRTEVLMPAWQFFKLLPWYTDHMPTSDAQVAAHFAKKRPVLGICLKRYAFTNKGQATRNGTFVDIPLEIAVPNFVSDDSMQEDGPLVGNFRLILQSVVCHRGVSVTSGHYICLCRGMAANATTSTPNGRPGSSDSEDNTDPWMRFDDLAQNRVTYVDIQQALRDETPYLLFYQVQPIDDDGRSIHDLPSYAEATSRTQSDSVSLEKPYLHAPPGSDNALTQSNSDMSGDATLPNTEQADFAASSERTSLDATTALDGVRGRSSASISEEGRRSSIAFDEGSFAGSTSGGSVTGRADGTNNSQPTTPAEEKSSNFLSVASKIGSRRGSRQAKNTATSRSRPTSVGPDGNASRFSINMTKLTQRMSRNDLPSMQPSDAVAAELTGQANVEKMPVVSAFTVPAAESKEPVVTAKALPKQRKDKAAMRHERHKRKQEQQDDDRQCRLM